jgi:hypothetical protein
MRGRAAMQRKCCCQCSYFHAAHGQWPWAQQQGAVEVDCKDLPAAQLRREVARCSRIGHILESGIWHMYMDINAAVAGATGAAPSQSRLGGALPLACHWLRNSTNALREANVANCCTQQRQARTCRQSSCMSPQMLHLCPDPKHFVCCR